MKGRGEEGRLGEETQGDTSTHADRSDSQPVMTINGL